MGPDCILTADSRYESFPRVAAQLAMLRGLACYQLDPSRGELPARVLDRTTLFAMSHSTLSGLRATEARRLKNQIETGNTLYIRGGFKGGETCSLGPFAHGNFEVVPGHGTVGYSFADHELVPAVLRGERAQAGLLIPGARGLEDRVEILAMGHQAHGPELPLMFAIACGAGTVIYDLLPDEVPLGEHTAVVDRLSDAAYRCWDLGALIAVNRAQGRDPSFLSAYNFTLDDRPRNFDHFSAGRIRRWLQHVESCCPGAHVDFGWTPDDSHPSAGYVRAIKDFNTGFAWHGLWHHCDHRMIADFAAQYAQGERLVRRIRRRYGVTFQPVMIFPYLRVNLDSLRFLTQVGFAAALREREPELQALPPFMQRSSAFYDLYTGRFSAPRRVHSNLLTRDVMLGHAALDLPIITGAHPYEVGLRRWSALYSPGYEPSTPFSHVAAFAREKHLVAKSLEEIAAEMAGCPLPIASPSGSAEQLVEAYAVP